jgi:hypothetical protein
MPETHEHDAEEKKEEQASGEQASEAQQKAREAKEEHEQAEEKMKELEESDEPPQDLEEWPDDAAKYVTYGGGEGDHGYDEGPEQKLGPSSLQRHEDGSVTIDGEKVDDPDEYKGKPIKGGPTDPETPELPGERKKREKLERREKDGSGQQGEESDLQQEARSD